ncbi:hypothetical protein GCM10025768_22670 [Microbacterium pseudoresistens]|uniref:Uncharacterized protein n=1 Tax=Microbacterium pseudoresistens TaxID=640634 RepID=A0A7Y9ETA3_9MICO|nr:hypothetical protein [Microbacterium pseudoresistens]NYD53564.1 hypothetical protein [Microbacterium pseudoresistens]
MHSSSRTGIRTLVVAGLIVLGVVIGLVLQNVWLGLALALLVAIVWFVGFESRRGGNAGIHDDDDDGVRL